MVEDPIRIITSLADDGTSLISRNVVLLPKPSSKATVVQELYAPGSFRKASNFSRDILSLLQAHVSPNAHLEMVTLQAMATDTVNVSNRKAFVERDGKDVLVHRHVWIVAVKIQD